MKKLIFEWDNRKNASNTRKHGISFEEAQAVFFDEKAIEFDDPDHSIQEERFILLVPPSNRLHALKGDRKEQHSISINDQWRICFRFIEGDAYDVEITDYH